MYPIDGHFILKLVLVLFIVLTLLLAFNVVMSKRLNVERRKFFSYNYVNHLHKKIDWGIRSFFIIVIIIGYLINKSIIDSGNDPILLLQPLLIVFIFFTISNIVTAIIERKYAENPNAYKLTISEIIFVFILLIIIYITDFFYLFSNNNWGHK